MTEGVVPTKILIIEDEALIARELQHRLTNMGWEVVGTAFGEEAVDLALDTRPDLILSDINLRHGLSGIDVTAEGGAQLLDRAGAGRPVPDHHVRTLAKNIRELTEILTLVLPAEEENDGTVEAGQRAHGRGDVRGLRVVDPEHAVMLRDGLQPVRQRLRGPDNPIAFSQIDLYKASDVPALLNLAAVAR